MAQALVQARVDADLKENVDIVLQENGLDIPTAIRMFMSKILQVGGIPFDVRRPSIPDDLAEAMEEANRLARDPNVKRYSSFAELLEDIDGDEE